MNRHVQPALQLERTLQGGRKVIRLAFVGLFVEQLIHLCHYGAESVFALTAGRHEKVVGGDRVEALPRQADICRDLAVQIRPHAHQRLGDAGQLFHILGDDHQGDGIVIRVFPYL